MQLLLYHFYTEISACTQVISKLNNIRILSWSNHTEAPDSADFLKISSTSCFSVQALHDRDGWKDINKPAGLNFNARRGAEHEKESKWACSPSRVSSSHQIPVTTAGLIVLGANPDNIHNAHKKRDVSRFKWVLQWISPTLRSSGRLSAQCDAAEVH